MTDYEADQEAWRREMDARLRKEEGWLSLAGLFWLKPGRNSIGSDPQDDVILPTALAEPSIGVLELGDGRAILRASPGVELLAEGRSTEEVILHPDTGPQANRVRVADLTLQLIQRGARWGLRVWDRQHPARQAFPGRVWFPCDPSLVLQARFTPFDPPRTLLVPTVLGDTEPTPSPGMIDFMLGASSLQLVASSAEDDGLFVVFADRTNGVSTYPGGRFLMTGLPAGDRVTVDFNRAYNPPCAFTPFATCPLPSAQNRLEVSIEAGERYITQAKG